MFSSGWRSCMYAIYILLVFRSGCMFNQSVRSGCNPVRVSPFLGIPLLFFREIQQGKGSFSVRSYKKGLTYAVGNAYKTPAPVRFSLPVRLPPAVIGSVPTR